MHIAKIATFAASALALSSAAGAATLYDQSYNGTEDVYSSQNDISGGNGNYATVYDNFTLGSDSNVTGLNFTGGFFNPPEAAGISQFTVTFYADSAGSPGSVVSTTVVAGNGGESCSAPGLLAQICSYQVGLDFDASAGTQYWLSIVADVGFPPQWGMATSNDGDGIMYQDFLGDRSVIFADMAFTLTGDLAAPVVPEPASWAMMIAGFGLVGGAMRRRASVTLARA